jgi:hypothetical protein
MYDVAVVKGCEVELQRQTFFLEMRKFTKILSSYNRFPGLKSKPGPQ